MDTDRYYEFINFPGYLLKEDGYFMMEQGYPLMQVIPFKRGFKKEAKIKNLSDIQLMYLHPMLIRISISPYE